MENEANVKVTTETVASENTVATDENKTSVQSQPETQVKSYSEEEYNKAIQSASSKAKYDILKDLGINSVDEFKSLKESYEKAIKDTDDLRVSNEKLAHTILLKDLNVKDDVADDFLDLAKKRISDEKDLRKAAEEVAELYPMMLNGVEQQNVKTGIEKTEGSKKENQYSEDMLKRYPWLKNNKKV